MNPSAEAAHELNSSLSEPNPGKEIPEENPGAVFDFVRPNQRGRRKYELIACSSATALQDCSDLVPVLLLNLSSFSATTICKDRTKVLRFDYLQWKTTYHIMVISNLISAIFYRNAVTPSYGKKLTSVVYFRMIKSKLTENKKIIPIESIDFMQRLD